MTVVLKAGEFVGEALAEDGIPVHLDGVGLRYVLGPITVVSLPLTVWEEDKIYVRMMNKSEVCPTYQLVGEERFRGENSR